MEQSVPSAGPSPGLDPVPIGARYEVFPDVPLPHLDTPGARAFAARGNTDRKVDLFALICTGGLIPRTDMLSSMRTIEHAGVMRLLECAVLDWPLTRQRHFGFVYERPGGKPLFMTLDDTRDPVPEDHMARLVIQPLCNALKELASRGIVHGEVRPTNLFNRDLAAGGFLLGDCLTAPPSYGQSVMFLTIERGMAQPAGRGTGVPADDLYALGVTILVMMLGRNPLRGMDNEAILNAKMDRGSYPALAGGVRLSLAMMEPLRGLLIDDARQRWSLNDLDLWLSGRRLSPKQPHVPPKGARSLEFKGREYWQPRTLAKALAENVQEAIPLIEAGELDRWLRRSLSDEAGADAVGQAVSTAAANARGTTYEDRLVARVCAALDPAAPIRYKSAAVMFDGYGTALAYAFARDSGIGPLAQSILAQMPMFWVSIQTESRAEHMPMVQSFGQWRGFLEKTQPGFGIERVLYEMNPGLPCLSTQVASHFVLNVADLMVALEALAVEKTRRDPIDRHIAAFIAARYRKLDDKVFALTITPDPTRRLLGLLSILGELQQRFGPSPAPQLGAWLAEMAEPLFDRLHSRPARLKARADIQRIGKSGDLVGLLKLVAHSDLFRRDRQAFAAARAEYQTLAREKAHMKEEMENQETITAGIGRQVAAVVSSVIASLLLIALVVMKVHL